MSYGFLYNHSLLNAPIRVELDEDNFNTIAPLIDNQGLLSCKREETAAEKYTALLKGLVNKEINAHLCWMDGDIGSQEIVITDNWTYSGIHELMEDYLYGAPSQWPVKLSEEEFEEKLNDGTHCFNDWDNNVYYCETFQCRELSIDDIKSFKAPSVREVKILDEAYQKMKTYSSLLQRCEDEGREDFVSEFVGGEEQRYYCSMVDDINCITTVAAALDIARTYGLYEERKWLRTFDYKMREYLKDHSKKFWTLMNQREEV